MLRRGAVMLWMETTRSATWLPASAPERLPIVNLDCCDDQDKYPAGDILDSYLYARGVSLPYLTRPIRRVERFTCNCLIALYIQ